MYDFIFGQSRYPLKLITHATETKNDPTFPSKLDELSPTERKDSLVVSVDYYFYFLLLFVLSLQKTHIRENAAGRKTIAVSVVNHVHYKSFLTRHFITVQATRVMRTKGPWYYDRTLHLM